MNCRYCKIPKCSCGGKRVVAYAPKGNRDGEVLVACAKCKARWYHYHRGGAGHATQTL